MVKKIGLILVVLAAVAGLVPAPASAGGLGGAPGPGAMPPLDPTLIGFKEHGIWYFPCVAPVYLQRIPHQYLTYGPPPPVCPPPPMVYPMPPRLMKPKMVK